MDIIFRELNEADASAYQALRMKALREEPHAFTRSYDDECTLSNHDFKVHLTATDNRFTMGVFEGNNLVACVHFSRLPQSQRRHLGEITDLYVEPSYRSEDIGKELISDCIERATDMSYLAYLDATCSSESTHAMRLFERAGFEVWGVETNAIQVDGRAVTQLHMRMQMQPEKEKGSEKVKKKARKKAKKSTGTPTVEGSDGAVVEAEAVVEVESTAKRA